ncbi:uncharacterized protein N7483_007017 [Penicillium malachiteum]|uniref:uncharacterized protein n=1 Tax=Penicillium malachiteum TaxID=1324776 RepID=UPI0025489E88|nr:uncharacterized protein N7483_007017 [Penicillium malachiteum]KAJ5725660.1 hypothetical protein N7483_007017 [Penicillium malachiteum]
MSSESDSEYDSDATVIPEEAPGNWILRNLQTVTVRRLAQFNDTTVPEGSTAESLTARRMEIARQFIHRIGERANIQPPFYASYGCNIVIGDDVNISSDVSIFDSAFIIISHRVIIGAGVSICPGIIARNTGGSSTRSINFQNLGTDPSTGIPYGNSIIIEEDCRIEPRVTIMDGVRIRRGTTIVAGSVVTSDIEANCLAGGNPAQVICRF